MRYVIILCMLALAPLVAEAGTQTLIVYKQGSVDVAVPASQYINVFVSGNSVAKVSQATGGPSTNEPTRFSLITSPSGLVSSGETSFGPFTTATTVRIEASTDPVYYSVGALAAPLAVLEPTARIAYTQFAEATYNTSATLLTSDMTNGIITSTQALGSTITLTLPTGTLADAATGLQINQGFEWSLLNLSGTPGTNTVTIAAGTGHTLVGEAVIGSSTTGTNAARFFTRKTAANTFKTYRIQ